MQRQEVFAAVGTIAIRARRAAIACVLVAGFVLFPGGATAAADVDPGLWSQSFVGPSSSPIVVRNAFVYAATDDGVLHVVGMRDGRTRWSYSAGRRGPAVPLVAMGRVWLSVADGSIHALNAFTGQRLWVYEARAAAPAPTQPFDVSRPALVRGVLAQREGRDLVTVSATTGKRLRSIELPGGAAVRPIGLPGAVVVGGGGDLYAISRNLDRIIWHAALREEGLVTPVYVAGVVVTGTRSGSVLAIDARNGRVIWRYGQLPHAVSAVSGTRELVFATTMTGSLYAFDAKTGTLRWRFHTAGSQTSGPVSNGASVLLGSNDGMLYSLNADNGGFEWVYRSKDQYVSSVVADEGTIYMAINRYGPGVSSTRLFALDIGQALSGLRAFRGDSAVAGRISEQSGLAAVLVDSVVIAAGRVAPKGGVWGTFLWPYRFPAAVGNPNAFVRGVAVSRNTATTRWADPLAQAAGVVGITAGPASFVAFLLLFVGSVVGFALWPKFIPILGHAQTREVEKRSAIGSSVRRAVREVGRNQWMIVVAGATELVVAALLVPMRLAAGPAGHVSVLVAWTAAAWLLTLVASAWCRIVLIRGLVDARRWGSFSLWRNRPRAPVMLRVLSLYVVVALLATTAFFFVDLSGALNATWLLAVAVAVCIVLAPAFLADYYLAVSGETLPRSLVSAAALARRKIYSIMEYFAVILFAQVLLGVVGVLAGIGWGLFAALALGPPISCVLAALSVEICVSCQPEAPLQRGEAAAIITTASRQPES